VLAGYLAAATHPCARPFRHEASSRAISAKLVALSESRSARPAVTRAWCTGQTLSHWHGTAPQRTATGLERPRSSLHNLQQRIAAGARDKYRSARLPGMRRHIAQFTPRQICPSVRCLHSVSGSKLRMCDKKPFARLMKIVSQMMAEDRGEDRAAPSRPPGRMARRAILRLFGLPARTSSARRRVLLPRRASMSR
jgi:hypothetical protein